MSEWNEKKVFGFEIDREFTTDAGTCCWSSQFYIEEKNKQSMCRLTPQMNVTEIAKVAAENGKEPDWGRVMSEIPKVWKWMKKKIQAFILSI